jgi:hypothetical protein
MDREELTAIYESPHEWRRQLTRGDVRVIMDLIDQQAARIAELEAAASKATSGGRTAIGQPLEVRIEQLAEGYDTLKAGRDAYALDANRCRIALRKAEARADAAWIAGRDAAAEVAEKTRDGFLSDQYAANQPLGSFAERFACGMVSEAIRALAPPKDKP